MGTEKPLYRILGRRAWDDLEAAINTLAAEGYELLTFHPGTERLYAAAVMRLCANEDFPGRLDELMALAQQIRNSERELDARLQALETARESHIQEHDTIGIRAETLRNRVDRLERIADAAHQGVQGVLARLSALESQTGSVLDPRD